MRIGLGNDTCNNDMKSEMEMSADEYVTQTPFHLEPMRCANIGIVQMMRCAACTRKVCVCVRLGRYGVTHRSSRMLLCFFF